MLPQPSCDFRTLFESNWPLIERVIRWVCQRHSLRPDDAAEFASQAAFKMIENDYGVLRKFRGGSSLRTYLTTVVSRLFLDYRIQRWGKWRPSAVARRAGPIGIQLDRLLFRDGYTVDEAVQILKTERKVVASVEELTELARRIPARTPRRAEGETALRDLAARDCADDRVLENEHERTAQRVRLALARALLALPAEDRMLLRMRFREDFSGPQIAAALQLDSKQLYRRLSRLLHQLGEQLLAAGITRQDAAEALAWRGPWLVFDASFPDE